ncbi:hypothetical protein Taro_056486 [Colocasia esculenta]|uniref:Uncharacterized protein n=1 Tax=Colocasia esculenta TaxID=4460 RepID=A0A843XWK3_COLES|nr:hypothetical protein [Colocasia esculenta]
MRHFTDRVEVPILNWGLAGGSNPRANKYPRPTGARDRASGEEFGRRTGNLRMRPFTDRVEVSILNWGLAGGFDPRANKYPHPTGGVRQSVY